jgi:AhpD family alkylhydroperoxidase
MAERLKYAELAPAGMTAMRGVEHYLNTGTGLEPVLLELVRLRASLMNGCGFCVGLHTKELRKHHESEGRIGGLADWRHSDAYTRRERAALGWAEAVTDIQVGHAPEEAYQAVLAHFSEAEVVDLTMAVASINAWNRLAIAFRAEWRPQPETTQAGDREDDGGKVAVEEEA